ncbi:hypothetical protein BDV93DRAFT_524655 [Ceratobasidium sp. AG-I]|nr:hypothetical protein BDV93DRAFT_524655 [Ceratobasidium sp. AG-I]
MQLEIVVSHQSSFIQSLNNVFYSRSTHRRKCQARTENQLSAYALLPPSQHPR